MPYPPYPSDPDHPPNEERALHLYDDEVFKPHYPVPFAEGMRALQLQVKREAEAERGFYAWMAEHCPSAIFHDYPTERPKNTYRKGKWYARWLVIPDVGERMFFVLHHRKPVRAED